MSGGEHFAVNGKGDKLLIEPPQRTIGLGKREITLLDRLYRIVSVLNAKPDWTEKEWKSLVDVALSECVECFELRLGPDASKVDAHPEHEHECKMPGCNGGLPSFF